MAKFEVGQEIYYVSSRKNKGTFHKITKIGRKWVYFGHNGCNKFDLSSLWVFDNAELMIGKIYLSEQDFLDKTEADNAWHDMRVKLSSINRPGFVTLEKIKQAMEILFG